MTRRISHWEKLDASGRVRGAALQDLGLDCFATYCTAVILPVHSGGWDVLLDRAGFETVRFHARKRIDAMMRVEHEVAERWGRPGEGPDAPDAVPLADLAAFPSFWKRKPAYGPQPQPRYMHLLTAEHIRVATLPSGAASLEFAEDLGFAGVKAPELPHGDD